MRCCPTCGALEQRGVWQGKPWCNLCPITGFCVDCLAASVRTFRSRRIEQDGQLPLHDVKAAAAGDVE